MKSLAAVFALSATVLLFGCGGVPAPAPIIPPTSTTAQPPATPATPDIAGNWQFNALSTVPGKPPLSFAGSISQTNSTASAALHVNGSNCFNQLTTIGLTGTFTGSDISLTSTPVEGQVTTLAGTITENDYTDIFTGTYTINGGCGDGDKGTVTGIFIYIDDALDGTFTTSQQQTFTVSGGLGQYSSPSLDGSFGITGTAAFSTPSCFSSSSVTITPGTLSSGSFIIGTTVGLEFDTGNGTITFLGTVNLDSYDAEFDSYLISGNYTVSGGTCDGTGTAGLRVYNPWDY
jgi:hypothetical protein